MRTILLTLLLSAVVAASAFAQAGPERTEPKKKKSKTESADSTKAAQPDTTSPSTESTAKTKADTARGAKPAPTPDTTRVQPSPPRVHKREPSPPPKSVPVPVEQPAGPGTSRFVPRAVLCERIENREPAGVLDSVVTEVDTLWFFTEISDLQGTTISHRWKHNGEVQAEIPMSIGGPHWRVYSRKVMLPAWAGPWTVEVVDASTRVLARKAFVYRPGGRVRSPNTE